MSVAPNALARALREFFADHLPGVRGMSPHTVCSYRDAFTILLRFLAARCKRSVVKLDFDDLSPDSIIAFLLHLEKGRGNGATTRNARLAAVHAFARFVAANHPEHLALCQRILAVPFKRARPRIVEYLEAAEIAAILDAPDRTTPDGRRDHALVLALFNTGARVQEILDLRPSDLQLVRPFQVRLRGKGRKERLCPLWPRTVKILRALLAERGVEPASTAPLFRNTPRRAADPIRRSLPPAQIRSCGDLRRDDAPSKAGAPPRAPPHHRGSSSAGWRRPRHDQPLARPRQRRDHESVRRRQPRNEARRRPQTRPIGPVDPAVAAWRTQNTILQWLEAP